MAQLIITNGDSAGDLLSSAFPEATVLPWHDVLHEGPVPKTDRLEALTVIRDEYLSQAFPAGEPKGPSKLNLRDKILNSHENFSRIELWFEHDLYDQLQLIQVLDYFHSSGRETGLYLFQTDDYLGEQDITSVKGIALSPREIDTGLRQLASQAWASFCQSDPLSWATLLEKSITELPFLNSAVLRMLEELPDVKSGLSRCEEQILSLLSQKEQTPVELFRTCQSMEEAKFMGDSSFFNLLEGLAGAKAPLIQGLSSSSFWAVTTQKERQDYFSAYLSLTETGQAALEGKIDHAVVNNINRWWGGTHLKKGNIWRWDRAERKLVRL